jgi:hypothetical protein
MTGAKDMALLPVVISILTAGFVFLGAGYFGELVMLIIGEPSALGSFLNILRWASLALPAIVFVVISTTVKGSEPRVRAVLVSIGLSALFAILLTSALVISMVIATWNVPMEASERSPSPKIASISVGDQNKSAPEPT